MTKPLSFGWGDGSPATPADSGEVVEHEYEDPGTYTVTVSGEGTSTAECQFTYEQQPPEPEEPCSVTSIDPMKVRPGECYGNGEPITITGTGFTGATLVNYTSSTHNVRCLDFTVISDTEITATVDYIARQGAAPMGATGIPFTEVLVTGADGTVCGLTVNACLNAAI